MNTQPKPKALEPLSSLDGLLRLEGEATVPAAPSMPEEELNSPFKAQPQVPFKPDTLLLFGGPGRPGRVERVSLAPYDFERKGQGASRPLPLEPNDRRDLSVPNACEVISLERLDKRTLGIADVLSIDVLPLETGFRPEPLFPVLLGRALDYCNDRLHSLRCALGFRPYPCFGATAVVPIELPRLPRPVRMRLVTLEPEAGGSPFDCTCSTSPWA